MYDLINKRSLKVINSSVISRMKVGTEYKMIVILQTPERNKVAGLLIKLVEMTGLKKNSLLSTINIILAS